jgi:hypothetical protein
MRRISILWRRLDVPGHDACRLVEAMSGYHLEGSAVFMHDGTPAQLAYQVTCDRSWAEQRGRVSGWLGDRAVDFDVMEVTRGSWTLNGTTLGSLQDCRDVDLGFTPATNLLALRRMNLAVGASADCPAAWLNAGAGTLERLPQRYERRGDGVYWYDAPSVGYSGLLEVLPSGFVKSYPGLWEAVDGSG